MKWRYILPSVIAFASLGLASWALAGFRKSEDYTHVPAEQAGFRLETVASGLSHPWAVAPLPDGRFLVTEREGNLRLVERGGQISKPVTGLPKIFTGGQAGLLDVILAPDYATSRRIFFSFSEPDESGEKAGTAVATAIFAGARLEDVNVIFRQQPKMKGYNHWGSRLVISPDGHVFITTGDRQDYRELAQDLKTHLGKVIRIRQDGSVPDDNPFVGREDTLPEIWSLGHRNMQGATWNTARNTLWTHEHGARGGDEINEPAAGKNYGWPVIAYGRNYNMTSIGEGTDKQGMEQPLFYWDPSIAPSGMAFYTGEDFPAWKGSLFVGALAGQALVRLQVDGVKVGNEERLLENELGERIRDVRQGPDGKLYILTDSDEGTLMRIVPR